MKVRVPDSAPGVEPVHGASRNSRPLDLRASPIARLSAGPIVLASATTVLGFAPATTPLPPKITSLDMPVLPTHTKMHSACSATCRGVSQNLPPASDASLRAFSAVLDQRATSWPARRRLRAIG